MRVRRYGEPLTVSSFESEREQQFSFWQRSAAVSAASSYGVSPFEPSQGGTPREPAGADARATSK